MSLISVVLPILNGDERLLLVLEKVRSIGISGGHDLEVVVVDDGSKTPVAQFLSESASNLLGSLKIVRLESNMGRANARNIGFRESSGAHVWFLDADCVPVNGALNALMEAIDSADIVVSPIWSEGEDFWAEYVRDVSEKRLKQTWRGFSSNSFLVGRQTFQVLGGFFEAYRHYGFEDRDFFVEAEKKGLSVRWCPKARVLHEADASVDVLVEKARLAGRHSAGIFSARHGVEYRRMSYGKLDRILMGNRLGRGLLAVLWLLDPWIVRLAVWSLSVDLLGFRQKQYLVRVVTSLGYLRGVRQATIAE